MTSIPLFFDSRKGQGKSEDFITSFNPPLQLDIKKSYEMSLINAQIWYSWHNITSSNNKFFYSPDGVAARLLSIPPGSYNIEDLNNEIKYLMEQRRDDKNNITITPNFNTLKSRIELKNDYIVDFRIPNSIGDVLGFGSAFLGVNGIHNSQNPVNITNINSLQIHCSLIDGSYINGASSDLLYTLSPNVPPGYLIQVEPKQNIYVPIKNLSQIDSIRFSIKYQDNNFVNMNNERVTYYVHLGEIM